jgi:hypothetical protein
LDLRAAAMLASGKGSMVTPLKKGMECAENRLKRGRYANSLQVQEMDCHGAEGEEMIGPWNEVHWV